MQQEDINGAVAIFLMRLVIVSCLCGTCLCDGPLLRGVPFSYVLVVDIEVLMIALLVVG